MAVDLAMNGMVHRALQRELDRVEAFVQAGDLGAARKHWWFFSQMLHHHHEVEDEYLFPLVRARSTDAGEIATMDALEAEHVQLHAELQTCDGDFRRAESLPESTVSDLSALRLVLAAHSAHEEADGERILVKYVTDEDMKPFNEANRKAPNAMLVFPWIADGGSPADQRVYDVLPGPVRLFLKPVMKRKYKAYFR